MYDASFRLRGKTYDYKIQYDAVKKFMVLPKPDEMHCMLCLGLDPPLRQGQTRYPFVVMQFKKDEEVTIDLNLDEKDLEGKYKDKLEPHYEEPLHHVVAKIFRGLGNKKISSPAKDFITYVKPFPLFPSDRFANTMSLATATSTASSVPSRPAKASSTA
jgi:structure-specific recognition protein 1